MIARFLGATQHAKMECSDSQEGTRQANPLARS
jgi:hypothetical protein